MPAVWTDSNDRVMRKHYQPDDVDTSDAYVVDSIPEDTSNSWEVRELYYTEAGGFSENVWDPMQGTGLTDDEKQELYRRITRGDYKGTVEFVHNHF